MIWESGHWRVSLSRLCLLPLHNLSSYSSSYRTSSGKASMAVPLSTSLLYGSPHPIYLPSTLQCLISERPGFQLCPLALHYRFSSSLFDGLSSGFSPFGAVQNLGASGGASGTYLLDLGKRPPWCVFLSRLFFCTRFICPSKKLRPLRCTLLLLSDVWTTRTLNSWLISVLITLKSAGCLAISALQFACLLQCKG